MRRFSDWIDLYGFGTTRPLVSKLLGLKPYAFQVVIESERLDYWFTEKLIDCFATGTVPIYWGPPSIGRFFNLDGILQFRTLDELAGILMSLTPSMYDERADAIVDNYNRARTYGCAEDWIYDRHEEYLR
jgi:hypothetical protein